ncbi:hypothetical protein J3R82DRAFT_6156 [Butyriboletus roseoflavus]|nr:hypothetical protein J3R82DRAFT_6156 [Butyriboletus roseoflavus]
MAPYYRFVTSSNALTSDPALLNEMKKANEKELKKLDERLAEAEKPEGESEISGTRESPDANRSVQLQRRN